MLVKDQLKRVKHTPECCSCRQSVLFTTLTWLSLYVCEETFIVFIGKTLGEHETAQN